MRYTFYSSFVEVQGKIEKNYALSFNWQYSARKGITLYLDTVSVPLSDLGPPSPFPTSECVPPWNQRGGGQHLPADDGGRRTQFGRLERKPSFLSTL
jgi:hypothetical protein